ncbi:hypothetical protein [Opitutus sp. GAS368]|jgi:hypothetical protein|uniref:hypothetical protein n=1 Tax=Opitutus sp. GAS368 TaxID=1882749 RepID=UPI000879A5AA|nr:hypothetical protein [Opitutus sp. GAS368]SDS61961.1 hypothetical protein SAMN05444173_3442 [Opitutus sp. GAS368]
MKKYLIPMIAAGAALAFTITPALAQTTPPTSTAPAQSFTAPHHERHPAIRAAIRALEKAKEELKAADHDFGGHRAQALADCDKAMAQLKLALEYDKK